MWPKLRIGRIFSKVWGVLSFSRVDFERPTPLTMVHLAFAFSILPVNALGSGKMGANFLLCHAVVIEASLDTGVREDGEC